MKIRELMDSIRDLDMVMPEFQREYVWEREQAKQLMVSLFRDYPTGSLLFWKTANPPEIKNAAIPLLSVLGPLTANILTGSFLVETVFQIPGVGKYFVQAVISRDYPLVSGVTLLYASTLLFSNFIVDFIANELDPRLQEEENFG